MKSFLSLVLIAILAFVVLPKIIPHPEELKAHLQNVTDTIEKKIGEGALGAIRDEITKTAPLILGHDAPVSKLTVEGVLVYTNAARNINGKLPPLELQKSLSTVAALRLEDMFKKQYFEHYSPQGVGAAEIAEEVHFEYILIGENIALGNFKDDETLVKAWMDSPGHRANILNGRFTQIGIAVGRGKYEGRNTWIAVQVFARPSSLCPEIDKTLKTKIEVYEKVLVDIKAQADRDAEAIKKTDTSTQEGREAYNKKIADYNDLVARINKTIAELKGFIAIYNAQVKAYNLCIKE